ncbi:MFS transporter [Flaviaesturariibacter flavus]|uniref:MFS transporter n=1 Tax=Flaviaesturariibacter flavus TaxID=2502780 RepID=A0A4R1B977_9BACT|nr:MFS transporter [Flaviaesturariibacter flavus]TCJ13303.1 MFS transporter [Flaviaesturariibacter flavus]
MAPSRPLVIIVLAQALCTSLWFGGNAVLPTLAQRLGLPPGAAGSMSAAVQAGFIGGTLLFAVLAIADRYRSTRVFFCCALAGAALNAGIPFCTSYPAMLGLRFGTGFLLAGIYPVGMKIAAEASPAGLGKALGYLVGALVVGTALPHGLRGLSVQLPADVVLFTLSGLAVLGGTLLLLLVPVPRPAGGTAVQLGAAFGIFGNAPLRRAAFGYFGHMWELYAFWTFLPLYIMAYRHADVNVAALSFAGILAGAAGCVWAGYRALRSGAAAVARTALLGSLACCLAAPLALRLPLPLFTAFLLFWGFMVVADSPMFSTLVARRAPAAQKGTALTLVTSLGFAITVVSIALLGRLQGVWPEGMLFLLLAPGPLFGLLALGKEQQ